MAITRGGTWRDATETSAVVQTGSMLECVVNISEGRDLRTVTALAHLAGPDLLDVHADPHHHRSVLTLAGTEAVRHITRQAVHLIDLSTHEGVHPRLGAVDVVPFVPLHGSTMADAIAHRDAFATWAAEELEIPCFLYGPEVSLPTLRAEAFRERRPDTGPDRPHPTAGAICVGAREVLVAYNLVLERADLELARRIAREVRSDSVRALGLATGPSVQVSTNLVRPEVTGPAQIFDRIDELARRGGTRIREAELVGLVPAAVLAEIDRDRWVELDLSPERTIEWALASRNRWASDRT